MTPEYTLTLKPISLNNAYKNVRGRGRVKTKEYEAWHLGAAMELRGQFLSKGRPTFEGPYSLDIRVGRKQTKADVDNLIKPIADALVKAGMTPDDRKMTGVNIKYEDRTNTLIKILVEAEQ